MLAVTMAQLPKNMAAACYKVSGCGVHWLLCFLPYIFFIMCFQPSATMFVHF